MAAKKMFPPRKAADDTPGKTYDEVKLTSPCLTVS
jgi:hypothetical protein